MATSLTIHEISLDGVSAARSIAHAAVWEIDLECDAARVEQCRADLSEDELERAERLATSVLRRRFIVAHSVKRKILARLCQADSARAVQISYSNSGKPYVSGDWSFNLSHSRDLAVFAATRHGDIGVDIEYIDPQVEVEQIAERFFAPSEYSELMALGAEERRASFFDLWCCKEAYLKATGRGIAAGLGTVQVDRAPGRAMLPMIDGAQTEQCWRLHRLDPPSGYAGALCLMA